MCSAIAGARDPVFLNSIAFAAPTTATGSQDRTGW
jgi:hypothetical protein